MGRAGRYTLSVMAWVGAYAGWSSIIGLVVAAVTGDRPRGVSPVVSALLTVVGPLVPTLVALWFNDWARDGFPTREQQRAARARRAQDGAHDERDVAPDPAAGEAGSRAGSMPPVGRPVADEPVAQPRPVPAVAGQPAAPVPVPAALVAAAPRPPTVAAHPLGVPGTPAANAPAGAFPVAPFLRDRD